MTNPDKWTTRRQNTAIKRARLSRPASLIVDNLILTKNLTLLDYGSGRGDDVRTLNELGFNAYAYDPYWNSAIPVTSDIVTLSFVLNVIECPDERKDTLLAAYQLANKHLVVALRKTTKETETFKPHLDGTITKNGTFQKYFSDKQAEAYIEDVLGIKPLRLDSCIFHIAK